MRTLPLVLASLSLGVVSCGDGDPDGAMTSPSPAGADQRYTTTATVLESRDHGPQLCLGLVAESLPPQCGGPDITNWNWGDVADEESAQGTTWGSYVVVGTYDGDAFTITDPPSAPTPSDPDADRIPDPSTPCDDPPGGWAVVDEATATDDALDAVTRFARAQADHAAVWIDQSINPALTDDLSADELERLANDPTKLILNLSFVRDLDRYEREIRKIWGGALCVSMAKHSAVKLEAIRHELLDDYGDLHLSSGTGGTRGGIEFEVVLDDGSLQREIDERYGPGLVEIRSALQPID